MIGKVLGREEKDRKLEEEIHAIHGEGAGLVVEKHRECDSTVL